MILLGTVLGLALGFAAGGRLDALLSVRLRFAALLFVALLVRVGTQVGIAADVAVVSDLRLPLYAASFAILTVGLWLNRAHAGLAVVAAGALLNGIAITANGGWMPVYLPAVEAAGLPVTALDPTFHAVLPADLSAEFLLRAGPLGEIIPFPVPLLANVVSPGDVLISIGLGWFVFAALLPREGGVADGGVSLWRGPDPATDAVAALDRPLVLGSPMGPGLPMTAGPTAAGGPVTGDIASASAVVQPRGRAERLRTHPYVRLALDARFASFWLAGTISVFGDRLHQIALGVLVYAATDSALATGLVFLVATLPNLLLGPFAGTFVDRWDQKRVLVVSDLVRAALVLTIPAIAAVDVILVYPVVFLVTAVSLFFRPAKAAVVPRLVRRDDLMAANSVTWIGDTLADILGYPLAGLFVGLLGTRLELAFWVDAITYGVSGLLLAGIIIPPVVRPVAERTGHAVRAFLEELRDGWRMLRGQATLFQNTLVSTLAQLSVGTTLALTVVYAREGLDGTIIPYPYSYPALETAIGVGNLVGGIAVGAIGARLRKGRMVVGGFLLMGVATIVLGLTGNIAVAIVASALAGIANLIYIIPSQTLFAELTPPGYMGRVVALRSTLVFSAMTGSMAVSAIVAEVVPVGLVIAGAGAITVVAALIGWALPAVRDA